MKIAGVGGGGGVSNQSKNISLLWTNPFLSLPPHDRIYFYKNIYI